MRQALANVSFIQDNGQLVPVATNIELTSKGFYTIQPIPSGGHYQVCIYKEGFEDKNTTVFVDATMDNEIVSKVCHYKLFFHLQRIFLAVHHNES